MTAKEEIALRKVLVFMELSLVEAIETALSKGILETSIANTVQQLADLVRSNSDVKRKVKVDRSTHGRPFAVNPNEIFDETECEREARATKVVMGKNFMAASKDT